MSPLCQLANAPPLGRQSDRQWRAGCPDPRRVKPITAELFGYSGPDKGVCAQSITNATVNA